MQPCSTEMQAGGGGGGGGLNMTSLLNLQDLHPSHFDPISAAQTDHDFLDQMFSSISPTTSPWPDLNPSDLNHFDESALLASKLRQHQISSGQQMVMAAGFDPPAQGEALFNGFGGSLTAAPHFPLPQGGISPSQFGAQLPQQVVATSAPAGSAAAGAAGNGQPRQRVRARRGQATDPHSIAERLRRERIAERMKALQELVPNANKTDKASMLDEIIDYVKFLQLQVKVLSMSRLGGASAVAPLVADMSSEGGGSDGGAQPNGGGSDSLTVTEHQVAKLMEEDMGSAMQYLQGKGLCLMPISLATAISAATSHSGGRTAASAMAAALTGDGPTSPSVSVLTVQSSAAAAANGRRDGLSSAKDAASVLT